MALEHQLRTLLLPTDPHDDSNVYLEVRAGTGGNEAALFAGDLALWDWALAAAFALGIAAVVKTSPDPVSYCDVSPDRLDRVRGSASEQIAATGLL